MDISKLKKITIEPKLYSLLVKSDRGHALHMGVYFSLEEAYAGARKKMESLMGHRPDEGVDIDLWNSMEARDVISMVMENKTPSEDSKWGETESVTSGAFEILNADADISDAVLEELPEIIKSILDKKPKNKEQSKESVKEEPVSTTVNEEAGKMKQSKNKLMKKLIQEENTDAVERVRPLLGKKGKNPGQK
jgi:hypothetical protein